MFPLLHATVKCVLFVNNNNNYLSTTTTNFKVAKERKKIADVSTNSTHEKTKGN
jgi:hypothetical protein